MTYFTLCSASDFKAALGLRIILTLLLSRIACVYKGSPERDLTQELFDQPAAAVAKATATRNT